MFTLYYAPGTCALASHIALEQANAEYETVPVNFAGNEQRTPEYLRINHKGRVPSLVTPRGILTETPAILLFIAQTYPQAALAPLDDPFAVAQINSFNAYLCATVHVAHAHRLRGHRWVDDPQAIAAMRQKVPQTVGDCFELIEKEMFRGPWVMGRDFGISDIYLFTIAQWLEGDRVDPARFPRVLEHRQRMAELPAVRRAIAAEALAS